MSDTPRPVWLTRKQRDAFRIMMEIAEHYEPKGNPTANIAWDALAGWDAAPADAEQAAKQALEPLVENDAIDAEEHDWFARAVLDALGHPGTTP